MNARWQGYAAQRNKYTQALEQRCSQLEYQQQQQQQFGLTDEQQRRVDRMLLDQRQKTEMADEARVQVAGPAFIDLNGCQSALSHWDPYAVNSLEAVAYSSYCKTVEWFWWD